MKNLNKFIAYCLIGVMALNMFSPIVFAKTLKERDQDAREKYQTARQQYLGEVNAYKNIRQQFLNLRTKYRKFKNTEDKAAYEGQARLFLEKTVDVLIKRLESLKNWVSNKESISEDEKQAILTEINNDINWLNEKKSGIGATSPEQIKEKAKEIQEYLKKHQAYIKSVIGRIWVARLSWAIDRFEDVLVKITAKAEELKASGKDTAQLDAWIADFGQKIENAKEKRDRAREKYQEISDLTEANQLFSQTHQFIKDANNYLIDAHKRLVEIVKEMKRLSDTGADTE